MKLHFKLEEFDIDRRAVLDMMISHYDDNDIKVRWRMRNLFFVNISPLLWFCILNLRAVKKQDISGVGKEQYKGGFYVEKFLHKAISRCNNKASEAT